MKRLALVCVALAAFAAGCGKTDNQAANAQPPAKTDVKHDGWWCDEHGIPEAECSMCSKKVADEFKKKGDWCNEHNRAKSQCFKCDPALKEKYAAVFRAKFGADPPEPEDN
jgi:hypothetical protein